MRVATPRGKLNGGWTGYRSTGGKLQRGGFVDDEKHGLWERWDAQGNLLDRGTWASGSKVGEWTQFNSDGTVKRTTIHRPKRA